VKIHIDTNVVIDVTGSNVLFAQRSARAINSAMGRVVGPIVYAELAGGFAAREDLDRILSEMQVSLAVMSEDALFTAGQAYRAYRSRGGPRERMLSDFLIGAHAYTEGCPLLTRDPSRYRTAFPQLQLIEP
jgi:predicted nucleic acid-binding protein